MAEILNRHQDHKRDIGDEEWEKLLDPVNIATKQKEANAKYHGITKKQWHEARVRCKRDLFFLAYSVLQYTRLSVNLHGNLATWWYNNRYERFRLVLLPRNHFKSTILTISDAIRIVLPYTDEDRKYDRESQEYVGPDPLPYNPLPWPEELGPDARVLIGHETQEGASRYLFSITTHFLSNPILMALFPDVIPSPKIHKINKHELQLPRTKIWSEPTLDTMGVGAKSQGRHYNVLKFDDLIGEKARDSAAEMQSAFDWFDNAQAFFSVFNKDRIDWNGTRWSVDDLYAHGMERYGKKLKVYRRPVEEVIDGKKVPIFPEEVSSEDLEILKKNRKVFSAQYENDPDNSQTKFNPDWIRYFGWRDKYRLTVWGAKGRETIVNIRDCNVFILLDPAPGGDNGIIISATDEFRRNFILEAIQKELTSPELTELVFQKVSQYRPYAVSVEKVLFSELYKFWWEAEMRTRGIKFHVSEFDVLQRAKPLRVDVLANPLEAGKIFINPLYYTKGQDPKNEYSDLEYQLRRFGSISEKQIHLLDALSQGPEVWVPGFPRTKVEEENEAMAKRFASIDPMTGYSKVREG